MLKIRLSRTGKKNQPSFRIVVCEARSKRNGRWLECLGYFNPNSKPPVKINQKNLTEWLKKGAQPTEAVKKLLENHQ